MRKKIKHFISLCIVTSVLALLFTGCPQPNVPEVKYSVTYKTEIGKAPATKEFLANYALQDADLVAPEAIDGYNFVGWFIGSEQIKSGYKVTKNLVLTAQLSESTVKDVTFSSKDGEVEKGTKITLKSETKDAKIYYTLDNTTPSSKSTLYTKPIEVNEKVTIKAIAIKEGMTSSKITTASYTLKEITIDSIEFNKEYVICGHNLDITIKGKNFDLINKEEDKTIKIEFYKKNNDTNIFEKYNTEPIIANLNIEKNTATATVGFKIQYSNNDMYLKVLICGKEAELKKEFTLLCEPTITGIPYISYTTVFYEFREDIEQTAEIKIQGQNLRAANSINLEIYDLSNNSRYGEPIPVDVSNLDLGETTITQSISVPKKIGDYVVKISINGKIQTNDYLHTRISILSSPTIDKINIPNVGTNNRKTSQVTAYIKGQNFLNSNGITVSSDNQTINNSLNIEYTDRYSVKITFTAPTEVGTYTITATKGDQSKTGTLNVNDYSKYKIGDFILKDSTIVTDTEAKLNNVIGIVGGFNSYGVALGIAVETNLIDSFSKTLKKDSYKTIEYNPEERIGDLSGRDNLDELKYYDPEGTKDIATNYLAYDYTNNFGTTNKITGEYSNNWFIPSYDELMKISDNIDTLRPIITKYSSDNERSDLLNDSIGSSSIERDFWETSENRLNYDLSAKTYSNNLYSSQIRIAPVIELNSF